MQDMNADVSLETGDCLVRKSAIGHDVVTNICTGAVTEIPWQAGDWLIAGGVVTLAALLLIISGAYGFFAWAIATDRI